MIPANAFKTSVAYFFAPIAGLMEDPEVSEIMLNGPHEVWIERGGKLRRADCCFKSADALNAALTNVAQFAGRPLSDQQPILEAYLPDGSRIEAVLPPLCESGPVVAIRRFKHSTLTVEKLIEYGTLTESAAEFLGESVLAARNVVIAGGTGTGKTSLLGALSAYIPDDERVVVIEDTREIRLNKEHVVYLESRSPDKRGKGGIAIRDLLKATLRLRPDRILVGEVRGAEALDLIQSMTSGHGGSLTTAHATSAIDTLHRLETMAMMNEIELPLLALRAQVASAIEIIVQVNRLATGERKIIGISRVVELTREREYDLRPVFKADRAGQLIRIDNSDRR